MLSLVIDSLKTKEKPYISLADFDLSRQEIRQELLKHIGAEFNGVIGQDVTAAESGAKKIDISLGNAYQGLNLGTRTATTVFLYSFSGGREKGATLGEIKRSATTLENPSSVVAEAVEQLKGKLFYLQHIGDKYFFSNQPNINRIILTKMENIKDNEIKDLECELLKKSITGGKFKVFIWEDNHANIADSEDLKLVILKKENSELIDSILKNKGASPRINKNTLFFLYPAETEIAGFTNNIKKKIAYDYIEQDKSLTLSDEQRKEIKRELKKIDEGLKESIRRLYRTIAIPDKTGIKVEDLGIPTFGEQKALDYEVYDKLRSGGEILEKIVPLVIKEKYLTGKEYVLTTQLYQSTLRTPGEPRPTNREVLEKGILEGVLKGTFGVGELEDDKPICRYFKEHASLAFSDGEVLISEHVCLKQKKEEEKLEGRKPIDVTKPTQDSASKKTEQDDISHSPKEYRESLMFRFIVPKGKVSNVMGVMNYLQSKFRTLDIEIIATDGKITNQEIEDKIREAFRQMGLEIDIE